MTVSRRPDQIDPLNLSSLPSGVPIVIRRFNLCADEKAHGTAWCARAMLHRTIGRGPRCARDEMRRARGQPGPRRVDDGDRDAGVHEAEPKQGVRPHVVGRDRPVKSRKEASRIEGVREFLQRVEERQEMTAAIAPRAVRGRACEGASRRKELADDHDQEH